MDEQTKINLTVDGNEVTVRHGEAQPIREQRVIKVSGTITAPGDFMDKRKTLYEKDNVRVEFSREDARIKMYLNDKDYFEDVITGSLTLNPELKEFGINRQKTYGNKELSDFLKMNRVFFNAREDNLAVVKALAKFKAIVHTEIEREDTGRGDLTNSIIKKVDADIPMDFTLKLPLYVGQEPKAFKVDILYTVTDAGAEMWLESADLKEIITKDRDTIITKELARLDDYTILEV